MDRELYETELMRLWLMAKLLLGVPLDEMIAAAERADAVGSVLDPTLYREKAGSLHQDLRLLRAMAALRGEVLAMARDGAPKAA